MLGMPSTDLRCLWSAPVRYYILMTFSLICYSGMRKDTHAAA